MKPIQPGLYDVTWTDDAGKKHTTRMKVVRRGRGLSVIPVGPYASFPMSEARDEWAWKEVEG